MWVVALVLSAGLLVLGLLVPEAPDETWAAVVVVLGALAVVGLCVYLKGHATFVLLGGLLVLAWILRKSDLPDVAEAVVFVAAPVVGAYLAWDRRGGRRIGQQDI
jgi:hypothetical protein